MYHSKCNNKIFELIEKKYLIFFFKFCLKLEKNITFVLIFINLEIKYTVVFKIT